MMANRPTSGPSPICGRPVCPPSVPDGRSAPTAGLPLFTEPEMRRWPHPPEPAAPAVPPALCGPAEPETAAELRGLLSRQTQLLSEIRDLLEEQSRVLRTDPEEPAKK